MKKLFLIATILLSALFAKADDTAHLDSLIAAGNTVLPTGHNYSISSPGLHLVHNLTVPAGDTITYTSSTGHAINMATANKKLLGPGVVQGTSNVYNASGYVLVYITGNTDTVSLLNARNSTSTGILIGSVSNPEILSNLVSRTGYIGIFYQTTGANYEGGKIEYNSIDRTDQPASTVTEGALMVQSVDTAHRVLDCIVQYNTISMPASPADVTAECCEMRRCDFGSFQYNTCKGGSIGCSSAYSNFFGIKVNFFQNQSSYAVEYAASSWGWCYTNRISNQQGIGIICDALTGFVSNYNILFGNIISSCKSYAIQINPLTSGTRVTGGSISTSTNAIYTQSANGGLEITNVTFIGNGANQHCIFLDNSAGKARMLGGSVTGFQNVFHIYATTAITTDNIDMQGVSLQSTGTGYTTLLSGGAAVGTHVRVN